MDEGLSVFSHNLRCLYRISFSMLSKIIPFLEGESLRLWEKNIATGKAGSMGNK